MPESKKLKHFILQLKLQYAQIEEEAEQIETIYAQIVLQQIKRELNELFECRQMVVNPTNCRLSLWFISFFDVRKMYI